MKGAKFCLQTCFFCINGFARNSGLTTIIARKKKIHVKNIKKYRKYFQIEEDGLILCTKISVDLLNIVFQCNANWRWKFPASKLWS